MKQGNLIIGGAYFSDERLGFMDLVNECPNLKRIDTNRDDVVEGKRLKLPDADFSFLFGLKTWTRRLRKKRFKPNQVVNKIKNYVLQALPKDMPIGVLDDMNEADEADYGRALRKFFLNETNCKVFLLREYWTDSGERFDKKVHPFSICCDRNDSFVKSLEDKNVDLYFRGDSSSPDRKKYLNKIKEFKLSKDFLVYSSGEKSPEKLPRNQFLENMSLANFCLCFSGHGYCTFRYQEIPSVGSISVQPNYPWKVYKDYQDMISCVKYDSIQELKDKLNYLFDDEQRIANMREEAIKNFRQNHSTEVRFEQFKNYLKRIL